MKSIVILISSLIFLNHGVAQKGAWDVEFIGGLNIASTAEGKYIINQKVIHTPSFSLSTDFEFVEHFRIGYSIGYLEKGLQYDFFLDNVETTAVNKLGYLSNQILIKGRIGKKVIIMPEIGFSFDKVLNHYFSIEGYPNAPTFGNNTLEAYNSWSNGLVLGVGFKIPVGDKIGIEVLSKLIKGFNKLSEDPQLQHQAQKPTNILLQLGFFYSVKKGKVDSYQYKKHKR